MLINIAGSVLCDFVVGRIEGDAVGIGADSKSLLALEELGKWDEARASQVMTAYASRSCSIPPEPLITVHQTYRSYQSIAAVQATKREVFYPFTD